MEGKIRREAMERITRRLSPMEHLYFPRALQSSATTAKRRQYILLDLLSRDVAVFLERYGSHLTEDELREFDALTDDYEINWHLKDLRTKLNPTSKELQSKAIRVRNRRLAFLNKLVSEGHYFSEDAMREREPYLHHEYVGKFQDLTGRNMARPGERWSDTLLRRCEEARLVARIREEQQKLGVAERYWVGNIPIEKEEEEEEEEDDEEGMESSDEGKDGEERKPASGSHAKEMPSDSSGGTDATLSVGNTETASTEEMEDMMEQFTYIMQQKFLSGEDHQHLDYSKIDNDETLDDHWLREINLDAEEKYFAED